MMPSSTNFQNSNLLPPPRLVRTIGTHHIYMANKMLDENGDDFIGITNHFNQVKNTVTTWMLMTYDRLKERYSKKIDMSEFKSLLPKMESVRLFIMEEKNAVGEVISLDIKNLDSYLNIN
jgi:hypothetical protein